MAYKTSEMEERRKLEQAAGLISERFPDVKKIRLEVEFINASGKTVQRRCRDVTPEHYAFFQMKCPLDEHPLDLIEEVTTMVRGKKKERSAVVTCEGTDPEALHETSFKIQIGYVTKARPKSKSKTSAKRSAKTKAKTGAARAKA